MFKNSVDHKSSKEIRSSSRSAIKELENKIDINFYEKKDKNMYEGLIDAIDYVSTDYVIWLNSGDLLFDESFSIYPNLLKIQNFKVFYI